MKKRHTIAVFVCVLVMAELTADDPPQEKRPFRQRMIERFDTDGDGKMSLDERAAMRQFFASLRQEGDGQRQRTRMTWKVAGLDREALVYLPAKEQQAAAPLVFGFHGHGGSADNADRSFGLQKLWPEAIVVYMQGVPTPGRLTDPEGRRNGWQHDAEEHGARDLKFFDEVLATLQEKYKVDENRVYATGHSNGGGFTYLLWTSRPDVFAAIAPSAAGSRSLRTARPEPVPVMHIAGEKDQLVRFIGQQHTMQTVRAINRCNETGKPWADGCTIYPSEAGAPLVAFIHPGTHRYPAEAPKLIVRFFQEHVRAANE